MEFRIGSIPIRIRGQFLFISLLFASNLRRPDFIAVGVAVVFVSILLHEMGHAVVGRAFGLQPEIDLNGMGGLTSWQAGRNIGHWKSILISLAGPFTGFLIYGLIELAFVLGAPAPQSTHVTLAISLIQQISIYWGIMNLLPLLPMDGGNVMRSFLHIVTKGRGEKPARIISVVTGVLFLAYAADKRSIWLAMLGAMFTYMNVQALRAGGTAAVVMPPKVTKEQIAESIKRANDALEREDSAHAVTLLRSALAANPPADLRKTGVRLFAYALLVEGGWRELMQLLENERSVLGREELVKYASTARELGREEEATRIDALMA